MIDKIIVKIKRYPFQTGIVIGVLMCLLCVGFVSLFQDHGKTLAGNSEIIQQDYLRMAINEYYEDGDDQLAEWRFKHLGNKSVQTLKFMQADETVPVQQLVSFAEAVGQKDKLGSGTAQQQNEIGTPSNPRKGMSTFGKVLLTILALIIVGAGVLYLISLIKTKNKQKKRSDVSPLSENEPINMITPEKARSVQNDTPDTLFDLDSLFPQNDGADEIRKESSEAGTDGENDSEQSERFEESETQEDQSENDSHVNEDNADNNEENIDVNENEEPKQEENAEVKKNSEPKPEEKAEIEEQDNIQQFINEHKELFSDEENNNISSERSEIEKDKDEISSDIPSGLDIKSTVHDFVDTEDNHNSADENKGVAEIDPQESLFHDMPQLENKNGETEKQPVNDTADPGAEKPLIETDSESEGESEDELLKIIRGSTAAQSEKPAVPDPAKPENQAPSVSDQEYSEKTADVTTDGEQEKEEIPEDDILIHYQSVYRIGNDMYDEVFSIDQGDVFRGECGIGIGETLNNTEPKAVTAFEVWLFDKDDIHTATWYLMSDFALDNEGISSRLSQRGKCDRIRKNDLYVLETETLIVEIKVLDLEYGTEMEEKNSYFTNVAFDVIAREKPVDRTVSD